MPSMREILAGLPTLGQIELAPTPKGQSAPKPAKAAQRDRKLLDVAHEAPCMLRLGAKGCGTHPSVPCHSDMLAHGRGAGHKSHDALAVPGCPSCHEAFTRRKLGKDGYALAWGAAMARYLVWLWQNGKVRLA